MFVRLVCVRLCSYLLAFLPSLYAFVYFLLHIFDAQVTFFSFSAPFHRRRRRRQRRCTQNVCSETKTNEPETDAFQPAGALCRRACRKPSPACGSGARREDIQRSWQLIVSTYPPARSHTNTHERPLGNGLFQQSADRRRSPGLIGETGAGGCGGREGGEEERFAEYE